jgi:DNA repair protein RecO (recombination protein O)
MEQIRIQGLCLSTLSVGEADLLLTLLSEEQGVIKVYARGIRRPSRRDQFVACRPGTVGDWILRKGRGELCNLEEVEVLYYPDALFQRWEQLHDVLAMFQAILDSQWAGKPVPALYALALTFMRQAEVQWSSALLPVFLLKLLVHEGVFPVPVFCELCNGQGEPWDWSPSGGLLCYRHGDPHSPLLCSLKTLEKWTAMSSLRSFESIRAQEIPAAEVELLQRVSALLFGALKS